MARCGCISCWSDKPVTKQPDKRKADARKAGGRAAGRPTADEEALFRAAMTDAKPIERRSPQAEKPAPPVRPAEAPQAITTTRTVLGDPETGNNYRLKK